MTPKRKRTQAKVVPLRPRPAPAPVPPAAPAEPPDPEVAIVRASERIEIRCGEAKIVLTKEGKILLNGSYLSLDSDGTVRVRGASVDLN
jgi:hypothetical protein